MIHDDENKRRERRASAGRDGNVRNGPAPRRDTDSVEGRVVVLEEENKRLRAEISKLRDRVARLEALDELHELGEAAVA